MKAASASSFFCRLTASLSLAEAAAALRFASVAAGAATGAKVAAAAAAGTAGAASVAAAFGARPGFALGFGVRALLRASEQAPNWAKLLRSSATDA